MKRIVALCLVAAGMAYGCDSYDPPEGASPTDTIAPAPNEPVVPGANEPGPQELP